MTTAAGDANTLLMRDLPCAQCGYNLRGLGDDGVCPECGAAIGESVARFMIMRAAARPLAEMPRGWVVKLAIGCTMLAMLGVAVFLLTTAHLLLGVPWRNAWAPIEILVVIALWLCSATEPSSASVRALDRTLVWTIRIAAPIVAFWLFVSMPLRSPDIFWPPVFAFLTAATTACVMLRLAHFAGRMSRRDLRGEAIVAMIVLPIATFVQVTAYLTITFPSGQSWWTLPEPVIGEASAIVAVPFVVMLGHRWDDEMIFWTALAMLMTWILTLLPRFSIALWRAVVAPRRARDATGIASDAEAG
jgi:hypothetical protein